MSSFERGWTPEFIQRVRPTEMGEIDRLKICRDLRVNIRDLALSKYNAIKDFSGAQWAENNKLYVQLGQLDHTNGISQELDFYQKFIINPTSALHVELFKNKGIDTSAEMNLRMLVETAAQYYAESSDAYYELISLIDISCTDGLGKSKEFPTAQRVHSFLQSYYLQFAQLTKQYTDKTNQLTLSEDRISEWSSIYHMANEDLNHINYFVEEASKEEKYTLIEREKLDDIVSQIRLKNLRDKHDRLSWRRQESDHENSLKRSISERQDDVVLHNSAKFEKKRENLSNQETEPNRRQSVNFLSKIK